MLDRWTGEVVGTMHIYGIKQAQLAEKMNVTNRYLSAILNCQRTPKDAEFKTRTALHELLREKKLLYAETESN